MLATHLKTAWKDLLNVDRLPRDFSHALAVREPRDQDHARLIDETEFRRLLEAAASGPGFNGSLPHSTLGVALLWTLWDTGFRASELLSLNVGDVTFDGTNGARLALREEAPLLGEGDLKTGARTIYVCECVGPLKALLGLHPDAGNARAPLFPTFRYQGRRMRPLALGRFLHRIADKSGVDANSSSSKPVTARDFRHTSATRDARKGWNEAQLRAKYGWGPGATMPSHYVHLANSDLRGRVLRDAGVDDLGRPDVVESMSTADQLAALLKRLSKEA